MKDDNQDLAKLLHHDARRIRETESFDPKLHQDTMRRIRLNESGDNRKRGVPWAQLKVFATAVIAVITLVLALKPRQAPVQPGGSAMPEISVVAHPPPRSNFAYRQALADGEDALMVMLDRDARIVLLPSAAVFQSER
jgi:hypothetical protein